jgi:cytochrome P450
MTARDLTKALDQGRIRELFDLRSAVNASSGGNFEKDPYPQWQELRESGPVHSGSVHELLGIDEELTFHGLPSPGQHFSVFGFEACDAAYRNDRIFSSTPVGLGDGIGIYQSMLTMDGALHRRYRSLVQPSFVPAKMRWWIENWIAETVTALIDGFIDDGRAELNVDFCATIPVLTISGSFGVPVEQALDLRKNVQNPKFLMEILEEIVAARRDQPVDDLISVLVQAELTDDAGATHHLSDTEIYSFAMLLLAAGSGTTWKQMGITLAAILERPDTIRALRENPTLVRLAIEESLRWAPTDPAFSRWTTEDVEHFGMLIPKGSPVQLCLGAANRDPARWERPDEYDINRPLKPSLAFGGGPHICLGMHVARAEMSTGISALLDRLPNLRLDPDAEPPRQIGLYERGVTAIPVLWG